MPKAPEGLNSFGEDFGGEGNLKQLSSTLAELIFWLIAFLYCVIFFGRLSLILGKVDFEYAQ